MIDCYFLQLVAVEFTYVSNAKVLNGSFQVVINNENSTYMVFHPTRSAERKKREAPNVKNNNNKEGQRGLKE